MRLIAAVMGTDSDRARTEASSTLLRHGFRYFEARRLYQAGNSILTGKVWRGASDSLNVGVLDHADIIFPRGRYDKLKATASLNDPLTAPIARGDIVGMVKVELDGETVSEFALVALDDVIEGSFVSRMWDDLMLLFE